MTDGLRHVEPHDEKPARSDSLTTNNLGRAKDSVSIIADEEPKGVVEDSIFLAIENEDDARKDSRMNDLDAQINDVHVMDSFSNAFQQTGACNEACRLWTASNCSHAFEFTEAKCLKICGSIEQDGVNSIDGWGWNYVSCLESVVSGFEQKRGEVGGCWKMVTLCRDIFHTGTINEFGYGSSADIITSRKTDPAALFLSMFVGLLATSIIFFAIRGVPCSKERICGEYTRRGRVIDHPRQESSAEEPLLSNE